jgi:chromosome segregation ATPase
MHWKRLSGHRALRSQPVPTQTREHEMSLHQVGRTGLLLLALAALPAAAGAQQNPQATPPADPQLEQQVRGLMEQAQGLHERLEEIQAQALQDPQLRAAQEALGESIKTAMERIDPTLEHAVVRGQTLQTELAAAHRAGDQAKIARTEEQLQRIEQQFFAAQMQAIQQPELASRWQAFQTQLQNRMKRLDPEADDLIARFQEIQMQLMAMAQQAQR